MTNKDIEKMNDADLATFIEEKRAEVQKWRFGTGGNNVHDLRTARKDIARGLTILNNRSNVTTTN